MAQLEHIEAIEKRLWSAADNLDVIISVGYRVKSHQGTQFRIWATQRLTEYIVKGFALNDERFKTGNSMGYFTELQERIRETRHIITAGKRLDQVARDFVQHYSLGWETGKAMLVCIDKITCVRMHKLIEFYWNERIGELETQLTKATDEQDEQYRRRQIEWMRQTRMAVVVSEEQGEVEKFRKWELDITPHRGLIKEGIDLPEAMGQQPQFRNMQRLSLDDAFKAEEHPFRVAIVCAMWLTGFDVPSLSTLCLDKPLKAHTLMQAIARANRINEGKNNGMIVDYCGILKNLRKAPATFTGTGDDWRGGDGGETEPAKPDEELLADLLEAIAFVRSFLEERSASLDGIIGQTGFARNAAILAAKEAANENDETRKRFEVMCRAVFSRFKACITIEGVNDCRGDFEAINIVYKSLQQDREQPNLTSGDIKRIKTVAVDLLETLKAEKLRINHWRDKESTRDAVRLTIQDYLWSEQTGLPETYSEEDVRDKTEAVFVHVFRAYPTVPSPYYAGMAS